MHKVSKVKLIILQKKCSPSVLNELILVLHMLKVELIFNILMCLINNKKSAELKGLASV